MYFICLLVALLNIYVCWSGLGVAQRAASLTVFIWAMLLYFALLMVVQIHGDMNFVEGFSGNFVTYTFVDVAKIYCFVLVANILLLTGQSVVQKLAKPPVAPSITEGGRNQVISILIAILSGLFLLGAALFYLQSRGLGYSEFVEYEGSNWGLVFLYSASSLICFLLMRRRHVAVVMVVLVYIYFAVLLNIRSFFVFSIFIIFSMLYLRYAESDGYMGGNKKKVRFWAGLFFALMLLINFIIAFNKTGQVILPESGLVKLMIHVMYKLSNGYELTGLDSVERFMYGLYKPLAALVGYTPSLNEDVQVYFARLIFGFESWEGFYHYPSLWYADAYSSFGPFGVFMGFFWGGWFSITERLIRRNRIAFGLFLPLFLWNLYMVVRGAIGNSTAAISYSLYLNMSIFLLAWLISLHINKKGRYLRGIRES